MKDTTDNDLLRSKLDRVLFDRRAVIGTGLIAAAGTVAVFVYEPESLVLHRALLLAAVAPLILQGFYIRWRTYREERKLVRDLDQYKKNSKA